jgi:DENN (AEX-3) domain/uDENN domain
MLCAPSFSQFALLEIRPEQLLLLENEYLFADDGPNHLDPFVLRQDLDFGHHYSSDINQPIDPISVASFCFPDGLRIRYIPKAALEGASRMGWIGPSGDSCHVLVFTNAHGVTEHGVAITIRWEINLKTRERQALSKAVYFRRRRRRAARKIQRWWRKKTLEYVLNNALKISGLYGISPDDLKAELTGPELRLLAKALKFSHEDPMQQLIGNGRNLNPHFSKAKKQTKMSLVNKLNSIMNRNNHKEFTASQQKVDSQLVTEVTRAAIFRSQSALKFQEDAMRDSISSDYRSRTPIFRSQSPTRVHEHRMKDSMSSDKSNDFEGDHIHLRGRSIMKNLSGLGSAKFSTRSFQSGRSILSTATPSRHQRLTKRPQPKVIEWARESYDTMKENDKLGSICIVEKCYTLIGCQPDEHVILLGPLQQLIDSERAEILDYRKSYCDVTMQEGYSSKNANAVEEERTMESDIKQRRHNIVQAMREKLRLTTRQALTKYPRSQCEHVYGKVSFFETIIPQIPNCELIKLPLPLPRIGKEWALAQFLLDIGPDSLVLCLKLMLLEHSILILGEELQRVSMFACALIELLKPFEWVSAFMPVLPRKMLDFVNCPVPFIAGVAVRNVADVENDARVLEAMTNGMSLLNLKNNTLQITSEKSVSGMMSLDPYLREKLKTLVGRLSHYEQADRNSSLRDFGRFVQNGLSRRESLTLHSVCQVLEQHFSFLCKDLAANDTAWKRYGTIDVKTNEFHFNPDWFLNTVRSEQSFHDMMARTQLFSSYVHERRQDGIEMREIMEGEMGYFIAEWIYEKWRMKKKRQNPKRQNLG